MAAARGIRCRACSCENCPRSLRLCCPSCACWWNAKNQQRAVRRARDANRAMPYAPCPDPATTLSSPRMNICVLASVLRPSSARLLHHCGIPRLYHGHDSDTIVRRLLPQRRLAGPSTVYQQQHVLQRRHRMHRGEAGKQQSCCSRAQGDLGNGHVHRDGR